MIHLVWNLEYDRYWGVCVLWVGGDSDTSDIVHGDKNASLHNL